MGVKALVAAGAAALFVAHPVVAPDIAGIVDGFGLAAAHAAGAQPAAHHAKPGNSQSAKGKPGKPGRAGKDGKPGKPGKPGRDGEDGKRGQDGKSAKGKSITGKGGKSCKSSCKIPTEVRKHLRELRG